MGFIANASQKIKGFLARDKDRVALTLAKGITSAAPPNGGGDLLAQYGYDAIGEYLRLEQDLLSRYSDYEEMDDYGELASALNIFADDATQPDTSISRSLWVSSKDRNIERILDRDLLQRRLRVEEDLWDGARTLCKYGSDYPEIVVDADGVALLNYLAPPTMRRIEGPRGELLGFIQDCQGRFNVSTDQFKALLQMRSEGKLKDADRDRIAVFEDWEVAHMRLRGKSRRSVYGYGVLESSRWIYKRLAMLEDSALVYRLQRAPERYAFYVDVGNLPPAEAMAYLNRVRQNFRKKKFVNPTNGQMGQKFDAMASDEDFFIPTRNGQDGTRIEVLGAPQWQDMEDIEYFRDKMFASIQIPKVYLAQDENTSRNVLSAEDVRFARSVMRIQREIKNGYEKVCRVHLAALNIDPSSVDFQMHMTIPSSVFEMAQLEVRNTRADLASRMKEFVSLHWILARIFNLTDDEITQVMRDRGDDIKRDTMAQAGAEHEAQDKFPTPEFQMMQAQAAQADQEQPQENRNRTVDLLESNRARRRRFTERAETKPISEEELFRGANKQAEKRASDKLDRLLQNDASLQRRLRQLGGFLQEIKQSGSKRSGSSRG